MDNQASDSEASNKINGYISWDSNALSLSDKSTAYSNGDYEELQDHTPVSLFQSVPIMAPRTMRALPPPNERHVNYV